MPVSTESSITGPYIPNGSTTDFAFDFKATSADEVVALDQDGATIPSALYSVVLDDDEGGTLSFGAAPTLAQYTAIYVASEPALTQPADFDNTGPSFNPAALTRALDRAAARDLRQQREIDRTFRIPFGETPPVLPNAANRANQFLVFDADGNAQVSSGTGADAGLRGDLASGVSAKGIALIDTGADYLPNAAGDGTTDDSAHFTGTTKDTIYLRPGKTYYFASNATVNAKVISLGGKLKRANAATVTFTGGVEGPLDAQIFDISNLTDTVSKSFDGSQNIYRLGTGAFVIHGRAYARWFMASTSGDQSRALTELSWTGVECEQWISTPCEWSLATLGPNTVIDAKLTCIEFTAKATVGGQLNIWGEPKRFGLFPITGLDVFQCRFTAGGEIDGNASNSWDVANNFPDMRQGNPTARTITGAANNGSGLIRITAAGHGFSTGNEITVYNVGGTVEANETWTVTVIDPNTFDLQGSVFANAYTSGGFAIGAINQGTNAATGLHVGEASTAAANGYHRAPKRSIITNAYIHNVFRNCIVGNYGGDITLVGTTILGNCYIDHLLYADTCNSLTWDKVGVFGFCRNRMIQISAGSGVVFPYEGGLELHPIAGESTRAVVQARSDIIGKISVRFMGDWDFSKLSPYDHMRSIAFGNAARSVEIDLGIKQVDASDTTRWSIFKGGGGTCGEIVIRGTIQDSTLIKVIDDNDLTAFVNSDFSELVIDVRNTVASTPGAYFDVSGDFISNSTIGFRTTGGQTIGYDSLLRVGGAAEDNLWMRLYCQTFVQSAQVATITGSASGNRFFASKCRSAQPSATLRGQIQFDNFTYFNSLDRVFMPRVRGVTVANLPSAANAGAGAEATVTDANAPALGSAVVGGGSTYCGVVSNGTNWIVG